MILGVDTGLATFGWALLDDETLMPITLGVVVTSPEKGDIPVTVGRSRRLLTQIDVMIEATRGCSTVVLEQMSFPRAASAVSAISLSYGAAIGVVAGLNPRPRMLTISPQKWQRLALETNAKKVDYPAVYAAGVAFIAERSPKAFAALQSIPTSHWNHAVDAMLLALVGAMRPDACHEVMERDSFRGKRSKALRVVKENGYPDYQLERARRHVLVMADYPNFVPDDAVPPTREMCIDGPRPCPHLKCRHHMWRLDAVDRAGNPKNPAPTTFLAQGCETCSLDEADRGEQSTSQIAEKLNLDDWRVQTIVKVGLAKLEAAARELESDG